MQTEFFPSRTLTLYLAKMFITRILGVLVMLVLILQMLDLLSESGKILAYPGNGEAELWTYISLRTPQLTISSCLPIVKSSPNSRRRFDCSRPPAHPIPISPALVGLAMAQLSRLTRRFGPLAQPS